MNKFRAVPYCVYLIHLFFNPMQKGWLCPKCTFVNDNARPGCEQCSEEKPGQESPTDDMQVTM